MVIRKDFGGCIYVGGRRLFAGDPIPEGIEVSEWLIEPGDTSAGMEADDDGKNAWSIPSEL